MEEPRIWFHLRYRGINHIKHLQVYNGKYFATTSKSATVRPYEGNIETIIEELRRLP